MKKLIIILALIPALSFAQKTISAKEIFESIDKGQPVSIQDALIEGDLDLTELSNKKNVQRGKNWNGEEYKSKVTAPISFTNCVFKGDFIAYKHIDKKTGKNYGNISVNWNGDGVTYSTDFEKAVIIENCKFEGKSEFKYSSFYETARFTGTKYTEEANYKYADFKQNAFFDACVFGRYASFKYTNFKGDADFYGVLFDETADFKYTNFDERSTFKSTTFRGFADFKYTNFDTSRNFDNTKFQGGSDFKYSKK
ncbi:MAG: pentapeptide repeat-containing protein [Spirosomataceae bacterium]